MTAKRQAYLDEADALCTDNLDTSRRLYGEHGRDTEQARHDLACVRSERGDLGSADQLFRESLESGAKILKDADHPDLVLWRNDLAVNLRRQATALAGTSSALTKAGRIVGISEATLKSWDLKAVEAAAAKRKEAENIYGEALNLRKRIRPDHPYTLRILGNLAVVLTEEGDWNAAEAPYCKLCSLLSGKKEHESELWMYSEALGYAYFQQGKLADAERVFASTYEMMRQSLPVNHPELIKAGQNLIRVRLEMAKRYQAERGH